MSPIALTHPVPPVAVPAATAVCHHRGKRVVDVLLAGSALLLIAPLLAVVALAIRLESRGPAFYSQHRRGLRGRHFPVLKFRTMRHEPGAAFRQAARNDARVTRLGRVLRRTSIDELPQLFNVLQGSMSLIGPRPHPIALDDAFLAQVPALLCRYAVKPGISGLAQISGHRGETSDAAAMQARLEHDMRYIDRWSFALDLRIVLATLWRGWRQPSAW